MTALPAILLLSGCQSCNASNSAAATVNVHQQPMSCLLGCCWCSCILWFWCCCQGWMIWMRGSYCAKIGFCKRWRTLTRVFTGATPRFNQHVPSSFYKYIEGRGNRSDLRTLAALRSVVEEWYKAMGRKEGGESTSRRASSLVKLKKNARNIVKFVDGCRTE